MEQQQLSALVDDESDKADCSGAEPVGSDGQPSETEFGSLPSPQATPQDLPIEPRLFYADESDYTVFVSEDLVDFLNSHVEACSPCAFRAVFGVGTYDVQGVTLGTEVLDKNLVPADDEGLTGSGRSRHTHGCDSSEIAADLLTWRVKRLASPYPAHREAPAQSVRAFIPEVLHDRTPFDVKAGLSYLNSDIPGRKSTDAQEYITLCKQIDVLKSNTKFRGDTRTVRSRIKNIENTIRSEFDFSTSHGGDARPTSPYDELELETLNRLLTSARKTQEIAKETFGTLREKRSSLRGQWITATLDAHVTPFAEAAGLDPAQLRKQISDRVEYIESSDLV